jgi:hypothetical protein
LLKEGIDYYKDEDGLMILTASYLKRRGYCCKSNCTHCPYGYGKEFDPNIPMELQLPKNEEEDYE